MSIFLNDNFSTEFPKPLDNRYGPFDDVASALAFLEPYKRYIGLTVGIGTSTIIEYWFDGGILDANFIVKSDHSVVDWGDIGGTLSNQTDLQTALNLKLDASIVSGGLTGQILAKDSDADYDVSWIDNYTEDIRDTVKATEPINKGQAVYISGANGTNQLATKADYTGEQTSSQTIGLAYQNFVTNQIGQIITQGLLTGIDTSGANAAGDPVYLGANGNLIYGYANKPKAPYHLVYIGIVTRKNANNGEIYVKIQNGYELEELHNVAITSPINNQGIFYNSTNGLWENKSIITALGYTPVSESGSYSNPSWLTALAWGKITSTPTTLSGYGITDGVSTSGSYSNPSWITDLAFSKITGYSVPTLAQVTTSGATTTNFITVGGLTANGSVTASAALARGNYINNTLVASANNDNLVALQINPTFTNGAFTGVTNNWIELVGNARINGTNQMNFAINNIVVFAGFTTTSVLTSYTTTASLQLQIGQATRFQLMPTTGNVVIQNGGTFTDAGFRLDVNGTARIQNQLTTTGTITAASAIARGVYFNQTLTAAANNDVLVGLDIAPTFTNTGFSNVSSFSIRTWGQMLIGTSSGDGKLLIQASNSSEWFSVGVASPGVIAFNRAGGYTLAATAVNLARFNIGSLSAASNVLSLQGVSGQTGDLLRVDATNATTTGNTFLIKSTGNILVNTTTDAGYRLDVNGSTRLNGALTLGMTPIVAASVVSTHKLQITIAGTTYYLLASNV